MPGLPVGGIVGRRGATHLTLEPARADLRLRAALPHREHVTIALHRGYLYIFDLK